MKHPCSTLLSKHLVYSVNGSTCKTEGYFYFCGVFFSSGTHELYIFDILLTRCDVSAVVTTAVQCRAGQKHKVVKSNYMSPFVWEILKKTKRWYILVWPQGRLSYVLPCRWPSAHVKEVQWGASISSSLPHESKMSTSVPSNNTTKGSRLDK